MKALSTRSNNISRALYYLSPDMSRDEWVTILMAIKSELDDNGKAIAENWSAQGESYNERDFNSTWHSIRSSGGVTIATLFQKAKEKGFTASYIQTKKPKSKLTSNYSYQDEDKRLKQVASYLQSLKSQYALQEAPETHGYLTRKGIKPHDVKYLANYRDKFGSEPLILWLKHHRYNRLSGLQFIYPDGTKRFVRGSLLKGSYYRVDRRWDSDSSTVILCEGFATACSVLEHCYPEAIAYLCFTANNMEAIAKYLRKVYPNKRLIICADNDFHGKKNVGLIYGKQAAILTRAKLIYPPASKGTKGIDFNDYYRMQYDS